MRSLLWAKLDLYIATSEADVRSLLGAELDLYIATRK